MGYFGRVNGAQHFLVCLSDQRCRHQRRAGRCCRSDRPHFWDSINDPLVGTLSDRLYSRLGRRRPFLLYGAIPFAFAFVLMFYVPPLESKAALALYYSVIFLLFDTLYTVVNVPYLALMPELTEEYDERSSLTGWRIAFSILASLVTAGLFKLLAENVRPGAGRRPGCDPPGLPNRCRIMGNHHCPAVPPAGRLSH
ncbi:MAG: MFS transporter [Chloroflexota bacterium]